jgi:hypothetical protein
MSSIRARLERLERRHPALGGIHWDNLLAQSPEEIVPDGIIDWYTLRFGPPDNEPCPIEEAIRLAGLPSPELTQLPAPNGKGTE